MRVKDDNSAEPRAFWEGKTPCWVIRGCIAEARGSCEAYRDQSRPCWQRRCLCKEQLDLDTCFVCEVYRRYGPKQKLAGNHASPVGSQ